MPHSSKLATRQGLLPAGVIAALGKSCSTAATVIAVPVWLQVLGVHDFGLWAMAAAAIGVFLAVVDLGLGSALTTPLAAALAAKDLTLAEKVVNEVVGLLRRIGLGWCLLLLSCATAMALAGWTYPDFAFFIIPGLLIGVSLPWLIGSRLWQAAGNFKAGARTDILSALIQCMGMVSCLVFGGHLLTAILLVSLSPILANGLAYHCWRRSFRATASIPFDKKTARPWLAAGAPFLVLQACSVTLAMVDPLVVGMHLSAVEAGHYAVVSRWFLVAQTGLSLVVLPLWPAIAAAMARGDAPWIRRTVLRASIAMSGAGVVLLTGWGVLAQWGIPLWTGQAHTPDPLLLISSVLASVVVNIGAVYAMFLNGAGQMRFQVMVCLVLAPLLLAAKWLSAAMAPIWCIPLATACAYAVVALIPYFIHARIAFRLPASP